MPSPEYLFDPRDKPQLPWHEMPLIRATPDSVRGYGVLVDSPDEIDIEIVRWPAQGWRPVDEGTGDEAGWIEGVFSGEWQGDVLYGRNDAVDGHYVLGWSTPPGETSTPHPSCPRQQVLLWHMNYHPDGGQLFFPTEKSPFVVPVALPGDDIKPEDVVGFWFDGSTGFYIHPNIWHEGIFPVGDHQRFIDRQGRVHARVSCDFGEEFGIYLSCPLSEDKLQSR